MVSEGNKSGGGIVRPKKEETTHIKHFSSVFSLSHSASLSVRNDESFKAFIIIFGLFRRSNMYTHPKIRSFRLFYFYKKSQEEGGEGGLQKQPGGCARRAIIIPFLAYIQTYKESETWDFTKGKTFFILFARLFVLEIKSDFPGLSGFKREWVLLKLESDKVAAYSQVWWKRVYLVPFLFRTLQKLPKEPPCTLRECKKVRNEKWSLGIHSQNT